MDSVIGVAVGILVAAGMIALLTVGLEAWSGTPMPAGGAWFLGLVCGAAAAWGVPKLFGDPD